MSGRSRLCRRQAAGGMGELYANQRRSRVERLADDQCQARSFLPVNWEVQLQFQKGAVAAANERGSRAFLVFWNCVRTRSGSEWIINYNNLSVPFASASGLTLQKCTCE